MTKISAGVVQESIHAELGLHLVLVHSLLLGVRWALR
jgi:hypothetical protein